MLLTYKMCCHGHQPAGTIPAAISTFWLRLTPSKTWFPSCPRSPDQHDRQVGVLAIRELITVKVP